MERLARDRPNVTLTMNKNLIEEIDLKRGLIPRSRMVEVLLNKALGDEKIAKTE
jgi:hypothetical protein